MANRISDMDKKGIFWKKFYNVNFPSRKAENRKNGLFDASHWTPQNFRPERAGIALCDCTLLI